MTMAMTIAASVIRPSQSALLSTAATFLRDPTLLPKTNLDYYGNHKNEISPYFEVRNPANPDHVLGHVPLHQRTDANEAIERCAQALPHWRDNTTGQYRSSMLQAWSRLIQENSNDIATIMTLESGKPLRESKAEVTYGTSFLDYYAAEAIRPTSAGGGFLVPSPFTNSHNGSPRGRIMAVQQAVGVTGLILPWNFPMAMMTRKIGPALAAGCTVVVKPSDLTPLTAMALKTLADRAGIPNGVFELLTTSKSSTPEVGEELCTNPTVKKISFTGSTAVGKLLMRQSSDTVKRLSLELGGNAPFVVFQDADLDQAVAAAMASKFRNAGQTCVCSDRFLVHASIHDEFVTKLVDKVKELKVGPGMDESTTMGPLITQQAAESVHIKVNEAISDGATTAYGGLSFPSKLGPNFMDPTVLTNVSKDSRLWKTETFGPVVAIRSFETEDEALALANDSNVGLAAYFCTQDLSRAFRFSSNLECGLVGVNEGIISTCSAPFGGVKESGLGREGSALGISEYLETKYVFLNC